MPPDLAALAPAGPAARFAGPAAAPAGSIAFPAGPGGRPPGSPPPPLVLVGHGSRDPRAAAATARLARAVARARPGTPVEAAYLELARPALATVLARYAPGLDDAAVPVVVPLLLTEAYHGSVDLPGQLARAGRPVRLAPGLGAAPGRPGTGTARRLLVAALSRRLAEVAGGAALDAVVLAAPGSRAPGALATVAGVAADLGTALGLPCRAGYLTGTPTVAAAVRELSARGARRIAVAPHFLAPGLLLDRAAEQARHAGVSCVARPLADAPEIVDLVLLRAAQSHCRQ